MTISHEQVVDLLPAYVLGALDVDEMSEVEQYIDIQRNFIEQLERSEEAVTLLAQSAQHHPMQSQLKEHLMSLVHSDADDSPGYDLIFAQRERDSIRSCN
ncbi:hypothetical protein KFU94_39970 [Chloroflexi bacterium TSY]|nr:hypothetical protein [Chloroflexi bacterium TSY]